MSTLAALLQSLWAGDFASFAAKAASIWEWGG